MVCVDDVGSCGLCFVIILSIIVVLVIEWVIGLVWLSVYDRFMMLW